jgi:hypothetical protein
MRMITEKSVNSLLQGGTMNRQNMRVTNDGHGRSEMFLHDNLIAVYIYTEKDGKAERTLHISDAGWETVTTKERLNGLLHVAVPGWSIYQKDYAWYLTNGHSTLNWTGSVTFVNGNLWDSPSDPATLHAA